MLAEEAQRDKAEVAKQKNAEAILEKIIDLQKDIAQEAANPELGIQYTEEPREVKN